MSGIESLAGDFTAYVTFEGAYESLYDQAGLRVREDEARWLKAGVELSDGAPYLSVVVTRGASDWSTCPAPEGAGAQRLRLTRLGDAVVVQFRNAERRWQLLRVASFPAGPQLFVGPMACSPEREGFSARFTEFTIGPPVERALHNDAPAE